MIKSSPPPSPAPSYSSEGEDVELDSQGYASDDIPPAAARELAHKRYQTKLASLGSAERSAVQFLVSKMRAAKTTKATPKLLKQLDDEVSIA